MCLSQPARNASKLEKSSCHEDRTASWVQLPRACHLHKATSFSSHIIFARPRRRRNRHRQLAGPIPEQTQSKRQRRASHACKERTLESLETHIADSSARPGRCRKLDDTRPQPSRSCLRRMMMLPLPYPTHTFASYWCAAYGNHRAACSTSGVLTSRALYLTPRTLVLGATSRRPPSRARPTPMLGRTGCVQLVPLPLEWPHLLPVGAWWCWPAPSAARAPCRRSLAASS